ncbi:MAG: FAD:protein FMN transferase [Clostridia bacterium]|nr:FAD:protein FMN transferase [Clostridia bacterium]
MKKIISLILVGLIIIGITSLTGCQKDAVYEKFTDYSFDYFDTVTTIIGYEKSKQDFDKNCDKIKGLLDEYHKLYTIYNRYDGINNLCLINSVKDSEHSELKVDQKIIDMLNFAKEMYELSDGKLNIAMGCVLSIWHNYRQDGISSPINAKLPPYESLIKANEHTDINNLIIDEKSGTVYISDPQMKLDVGAVAKGYAVEKIAEYMKQNGMDGYLLNVGGNVRAVGNRRDGKKWTIGIENPDTDDTEKTYIEYLEINDMSLVTSGSYQRFYTVDGKNYHHIIDPETLMPSDRYLSISVLCESSAYADALSTALFSMELEDGHKLIESLKDVEAMWVITNGQQIYSSKFKDYCTKE